MIDTTSIIDFEKHTVESAFKGRHYIVPAYQREYVWKADEYVEQFIADIWEAFSQAPDKPYFIGSMVTYKYGEHEVELIDGQQRMTTLFILLCVVYHMYIDNDTESDTIKQLLYSTRQEKGRDIKELSMQLQYEETNVVLSNIWKNKIPSKDSLRDASPSSKKLYEAYEAMIAFLNREAASFDEVLLFASFLLEKVLFIQIITRDIEDALKIFETINERGEGLNPLDLLKNMIFSNVERKDFEDLNTDWKQMISKLDEIGEKPLRFLRYFLTANYDVSDNGTGILPEDMIYKWLSKHDDYCKYKTRPFAFVGAMKDSVNLYASFLNPSSTDIGKDYLNNIPLIAGKTSRLHMVLLLASTQMDADAKEMFIKTLEILAYYETVNRIKSNRIEPLYAKWSGEVRLIKTKQELKAFLENAVKPKLDEWNKDYHDSFMLLNWYSLQQYKMKYILARLTKYVDDVNANQKEYAAIAGYVDSAVPIEHIMPKEMVDCKLYHMNEEEYEVYKHKYGNLTLLESSINSSIKTEPYDKKCKEYPKSKYYLTKSLPAVISIGHNTAQDRMNAKLQTWANVDPSSKKMWDKWDKKTIDARQELLYELSKEVWDIDAIIDNL